MSSRRAPGHSQDPGWQLRRSGGRGAAASFLLRLAPRTRAGGRGTEQRCEPRTPKGWTREGLRIEDRPDAGCVIDCEILPCGLRRSVSRDIGRNPPSRLKRSAVFADSLGVRGSESPRALEPAAGARASGFSLGPLTNRGTSSSDAVHDPSALGWPASRRLRRPSSLDLACWQWPRGAIGVRVAAARPGAAQVGRAMARSCG